MYYRGQNQAISIRYADMIKSKPKDNRSAKEIAYDVIDKVGLSVV